MAPCATEYVVSANLERYRARRPSRKSSMARRSLRVKPFSRQRMPCCSIIVIIFLWLSSLFRSVWTAVVPTERTWPLTKTEKNFTRQTPLDVTSVPRVESLARSLSLVRTSHESQRPYCVRRLCTLIRCSRGCLYNPPIGVSRAVAFPFIIFSPRRVLLYA